MSVDTLERNVNYEDVRESFVIALEAEGVDPESITRAVETVDDYVDNHYDKLSD